MELSEYELGWIVGWLEGEGSFISHTTKRGYTRLIVRAVSTDPETVKQAHSITGLGNLHGPYELQGNRSPVYHWAVTKRKDAHELMTLLRPHLSSRRQAQIDRAFSVGAPA